MHHNYCSTTQFIDHYPFWRNLLIIMSRFREDVFSEGEVGGHCDFKRHLHKDQGRNKSPLQSWWVY